MKPINSSSMKECPNCGKEVKPQNKFCNSSCAASYNNKKYVKRVKKVKNCAECGEELTKSQKKFCNISCQNIHYRKVKTIPSILKGECRSVSSLKKYLFETRGEKCEECRQGSIWNGKTLTLQLDHIDGNSDNCCLSNLRILCPNCHTQTETFGARNHTNSMRNTYFRKYYKNRAMV